MDFSEVVHTGPGTLAGRYLRMFWQPVCCSYELSVGQALPKGPRTPIDEPAFASQIARLTSPTARTV